MTVRRKTKRPRQRALANTGTNEITIEQHGRAYRMWILGVDPRDIQRECRLTAKQWAWMFRTGDASAELPSFESMWIEEVVVIRGSAIEAAKEVSTRAPSIIRRRMINAEVAGMVLNRMLGAWYDDLAKKVDAGENVELSVPSRNTLRALKVLTDISNGKAAADMFKSIYTDTAGARAVMPAANFTAKGEADPLGRLVDKADTENAPTEITDGFWTEWQRLSPEQKAAYANDGTDPDPKDILDAEASET